MLDHESMYEEPSSMMEVTISSRAKGESISVMTQNMFVQTCLANYRSKVYTIDVKFASG